MLFHVTTKQSNNSAEKSFAWSNRLTLNYFKAIYYSIWDSIPFEQSFLKRILRTTPATAMKSVTVVEECVDERGEKKREKKKTHVNAIVYILYWWLAETAQV